MPSLKKCYKYNNNKACCTAVHDEYISAALGALLPGSCDRKYTIIEDLYCLGCDSNGYIYNDRANKTLTLCLSFVKKLWNATLDSDLNVPTTIYDNCGFKIVNNWSNFTTRSFVVPSLV
jgi:hypothetical protein